MVFKRKKSAKVKQDYKKDKLNGLNLTRVGITATSKRYNSGGGFMTRVTKKAKPKYKRVSSISGKGRTIFTEFSRTRADGTRYKKHTAPKYKGTIMFQKGGPKKGWLG